MDCLRAAQLLFRYLDDELNDFCCEELKEHLLGCECCRCHFEFEKQMIFFIARCEAKVKAPKRLKNKIKKSIRRV